MGQEGRDVEIRIGVQQAPREIVLESTESPEHIRSLLEKAMADSTLLVLTDDKGRTYAVPAERIAYVEIGTQTAPKVGFATT